MQGAGQARNAAKSAKQSDESCRKQNKFVVLIIFGRIFDNRSRLSTAPDKRGHYIDFGLASVGREAIASSFGTCSRISAATVRSSLPIDGGAIDMESVCRCVATCRSRRIECAKCMLVNVSMSVTEIGLLLGFSESSAFTATFRKFTGRTPSAFRRSLQ